MLYVILLLAAFLCAVMAIRARRLLTAAIWLAAVSALVSIVLYRLGAQQVAVVELSVGAGLVTVLFVFAISIAGDDAMKEREFIPNWLSVGMLVIFLVLLGIMVLPVDKLDVSHTQDDFTRIFWKDRELDTLLQLVFIFTGVICLLGLLADVKKPVRFRQKGITVPQAHLSAALGGDKTSPQPVLQAASPTQETEPKGDAVP